MKIETPATGISKSKGQDGTYSYHIECLCTDPEHSLEAYIEVNHDNDIDDVVVAFYVTTHYPGWRGFFRRFKDATKIVFGSSLVRCHDLILDKQAALNFAGAINKSIEELDEKDPATSK